jgi:hypothetical protein
MGSGDFGSNGSVHWHIQHTAGGGGGAGNDPVDYDDIGESGGHKKFFRVRLKFPDEASAKAALANANTKVTPQGVVTIDVPKTEPKRQTPNPPEVSVRW